MHYRRDISQNELDELKKYNNMKGNVHTVPVQFGLSEQEKQLKLIEQVKLQELSVI